MSYASEFIAYSYKSYYNRLSHFRLVTQKREIWVIKNGSCPHFTIPFHQLAEKVRRLKEYQKSTRDDLAALEQSILHRAFGSQFVK